MKVTKTAEGWEIIPQTSDEQSRLEWLIESLQSHPGQQPCEGGANGASNRTTLGVQPENMMAFMSATGGVDGYLMLKNSDPDMLKTIQQAFNINQHGS